MAKKSYYDSVVSGITLNFVRYLTMFVISFLMIPVYIKYLGSDIYGFWIFAWSIINYFFMMDFNFSHALVKFMSEDTSDTERITKYFNTAFIFYTLMILAIMILVFIFYDSLLIYLLAKTKIQFTGLREFFLIALIIFALNFIFLPVNSMYGALQRYDLLNTINIIWDLALNLSYYLALRYGYGIWGMLFVNLGGTLILNSSKVLIAKTLVPGFKISFLKFDRAIFKNTIGYSAKLFATTVAGLTTNNIDKLLLGVYLGMSNVTFYSVGVNISNYIKTVPYLFVQPLMAVASRFHSQNRSSDLEDKYVIFNKYVISSVVFIFTGVILFGRSFINLWIGPGYELSVKAMYVISIANLITVFSIVPCNILYGTGKVGIVVKASVCNMIINIILSYVLIRRIGFFGSLLGTALALSLGSVYTIYNFHQTTRFSFRKMMSTCMPKPALALFAGIVLTFISYFFISRDDNYFKLFFRVMIFSLTYLNVLMYGRYYSVEEMAFFLNKRLIAEVFKKMKYI